MSTKSKSIETKTDFNQDERLKKVSKLRLLLNRPELGALGGAILVFIFFGIVAGDTGMFSAYGVLNFLDVSANLGIIAIAAAMLMIGGEFDLIYWFNDWFCRNLYSYSGYLLGMAFMDEYYICIFDGCISRLF